MTHKNYFEIEAANNFELGVRKGELFGDFLRESLRDAKGRRWPRMVEAAKAYVPPTAARFPELIEEYKGYAKGAGVSFDDVWTLDLDDELAGPSGDHCTTIVANNGFLVGHNEDWSADAADSICVLRRTIGKQTAVELFYMNSLGGNALSVNSLGVAQSIESVVHTDRQVGVPKKVIARWLSDTGTPEAAYEELTKIKRASGYHHTLVNRLGAVWSIECSAAKQSLTKPKSPFVHTNHFLTSGLAPLEGNDDSEGTFDRFEFASKNVNEHMTFEDAMRLLADTTHGNNRSVFNRRTIACALVDMDHMVLAVWLRREHDKGWVSYPLGF